VLGHYAAALEAHRLADPARIFEAALHDFSVEAPLVLPARIALAPGLTSRGLPGQLLDRLRAGGAEALDADGRQPDHSGVFVLDRVAPGLDCFHGATPSDELREALRRAAEEGWRNDQVELVTTDPDAHGVALDALCHTTHARATMLQGIPLLRTRVGRALGRWLAWLEEGLPVDRIREALEAGDFVRPSRAHWRRNCGGWRSVGAGGGGWPPRSGSPTRNGSPGTSSGAGGKTRTPSTPRGVGFRRSNWPKPCTS
jgi:hypothetical protein